jgi:predicted alpha-1,6-mannanase (GH76 family)
MATMRPVWADEPTPENTWAERAEQAQGDLQSNFWNERAAVFRSRYPGRRGDLNYWWQAHAIDVLVDGYERTNDVASIRRADQLYRGVVRANRGITIDYYDDMEWMALALLRLYQHTEDEAHLEAVRILWKDIKTGWNDHQGGGIAWRKQQLDYKNTPANAPAIILAARLYRKFGDEEDLAWAKKIYQWQKENLVDPETRFVWDGVNRQGNGQIDKNWAFSYNQGVYIGANLELFRITDDSSYRDEALQTAAASVERLAQPQSKLLTERGGGDGGLFKGIFIRYLTDLILTFPHEKTDSYRELIMKNAESVWKETTEQESRLFGPAWSPPRRPARQQEAPDRRTWELSAHLSGVMLMEHAAKLSE